MVPDLTPIRKRSRCYLSIILLLSALIFSKEGYAQKIDVTYYPTLKGYHQNIRKFPTQGPKGYLWFLNGDHLSRFNGYDFKTFPVPSSLEGAKENLHGLQLFQDSVLLLYTANYLITYSPISNQWRSFPMPKFEDAYEILSINKYMDDACWINCGLNPKRGILHFKFDGKSILPMQIEGDHLRSWRQPLMDADENGNFFGFDIYDLKKYDADGKYLHAIKKAGGQEGMDNYFFLNFDQNEKFLCLNNNFYKSVDNLQSLQFHPAHDRLKVIEGSLTSAVKTSNGSFWGAKSENDFFYYDAFLDSLYNYTEDIKEILPSGDKIQDLCIDRSGIIWLGTYNGLLKIVPSKVLFNVYKSYEQGENVFSFRGFTEDRAGNIYTGYPGVLLKHSPESNSIETLFEGSIYPFDIDWKDDKLWLNTGHYFDLVKAQFIKTKNALRIEEDAGVIANDQTGNIWLAHYGKLWNAQKQQDSIEWQLRKVFSENKTSYPEEIHFGKFSQSLWIGGDYQLFYFNPREDLLKKWHTAELGLPSCKIHAIHETAENFLWLATSRGLFYIDVRKEIPLKSYDLSDGICNEQIVGLLFENEEILWLSTYDGLSRFHIPSETFINFYKKDGIPNNEFNRRSFYKAKNGTMYFGSINGFVSFQPSNFESLFELRNKHAQIGLVGVEHHNKNQKELIKLDHFGTSPNINLNYWDRSIVFKFFVDDFTAPEVLNFSYRMDGFEENWSKPEKSNSIKYSSLPSGKYKLQVRAKDYRGQWIPHILNVPVNVRPPWWRSYFAYLAYLLTGLGIFYFARRYELNRLRLKNELHFETLTSDKLREVDQLKSAFFANISHEFRTPLTLLLGPLEKLQQEANASHKKTFQTMKRNAQRLLQLINQLLDLSKLESGKMEVHPKWIDLIPFLKGLALSYESLAVSKEIQYSFYSELDSLNGLWDEEQIEKIINNLIINAFKYSDKGGKINILIQGHLDQDANVKEVQISIKDSGPGIPSTEHEKVFDRFYRSEAPYNNIIAGTGIGLSLSKELVELMGGEITIKSAIGKGSTFIIKIPVNQNVMETNISEMDTGLKPSYVKRIAVDDSIAMISGVEIEPESANDKLNILDLNKEIVLIAEDNADVRAFIKSNLVATYQIIEAINGKDAFEKSSRYIPDLIISDLMMPIMDGYEFCKKIKEEQSTSHIPFILLTARADRSDKFKGLSTGADEYLTKPFDAEELMIRVSNLIDNRKKLRARWSKADFFQPTGMDVSSIDKEFLVKVKNSIEAHISDENYGLAILAKEIGISSRQLQRKLKALTDKSPAQMIRFMRMQRSLELLEQKAGTVSEIAYMVGFKSVSYFTKVFKEEFGKTPSEV